MSGRGGAAAALANKVGERLSILSLLSKITPKSDKAQSIDFSVKLVVELVAFCQINGLPGDSIGDFVKSLTHYKDEALIRMDLAEMLASHAAGGHRLTVGLHDYTHTIPFGVVEVADGRVIDVREKPTMVWRTNAGIYVVDPALLERIPRDTDFPLPALIEQCLDKGESVGAFQIEGDWIDVGRKQELERARGEIKR